MKRLVIIICYILCIGVIILLGIYNPYVIRAIDYKNMTKEEPPKWQGVINIWQLNSWRVAQSSKTLALSAIAKDFEKKHKGIFIEIENIEDDDYIKRIMSGEYPEIISYPAETRIELDKCIILPDIDILDNLHRNAYIKSSMKALPFLATSSVIMVNLKQAGKRDIHLDDKISSAQITQILDAMPIKKSKLYYGSIYALIPLAISDSSTDNLPFTQTPYRAYQSFVSKDTYFLYASIWELYAMERLHERDKGFSIDTTYPTDDIPQFIWTQCLSVYIQNADKNEIICRYIRMILDSKYQLKLADKTASLPVIIHDEKYNGIRGDIVEYSGDRIGIIPGIGIDAELIRQALTGDLTAKERLKELLIYD